MKNLCVNGSKKEKINFKISRMGLSLTAVLLVGATMLSGCAKKNKSYNSYNPDSSYSYNYNIEEDTTTSIDDGEIEYTSLNEELLVPVSINNVNGTYLKKYLENLSDNYHYEELYGIEEALDKYYDMNNTDTKSHSGDFIGNDNSFSYDEIYQQVLNNNKKYQEINNSKNGKVNFYKELDNDQLQQTCKLITSVLNDYLKEGLVKNVGELSCILSNLKILRDNTSFSNAYITDDDCLLISPNMLNVMNLMNKDNTFDQTVTHEIEHLLQKGCQDRNEQETKTIGICNRYNDLEINPLFFDWFYEASAEKEACNYMKRDPIVYKNMIGYLESLSLSTILNDNVKVNQTERLCTERNLNNLFEQFSCMDEEDKKNVIKMMFAIDIIQNDDEEFIKKYENKYGITLTSNDLLDIKYELKPDICKTYLKSFYYNLTNTIQNKKVNLQDVFFLIRLVESDINNHILYDDVTKYDYNKNLMQEAINMQQEFFHSLDTDYTVEDLNTMYSNYKMIVQNSGGILEYNCSLEWLDTTKQEYLKSRTDFLKEYSNKSIYQCYNSMTQKTK